MAFFLLSRSSTIYDFVVLNLQMTILATVYFWCNCSPTTINPERFMNIMHLIYPFHFQIKNLKHSKTAHQRWNQVVSGESLIVLFHHLIIQFIITSTIAFCWHWKSQWLDQTRILQKPVKQIKMKMDYQRTDMDKKRQKFFMSIKREFVMSQKNSILKSKPIRCYFYSAYIRCCEI